MKSMKSAVFLSASLIMLLSGCGQKFADVGTVQFKQNSYPSAEQMSPTHFAIAKPDILIKANLSMDMHNAVDRRLSYLSDELACNLMREFQKAIVSKGITISDKFSSRSDMTFSQKKNTTAIVIPIIQLSLAQSSISDYEDGRQEFTSGNLSLTIKVRLEMIEPLSGEKIWIKDLPLKENSTNINYCGYLMQISNPMMAENQMAENIKYLDNLVYSVYDQILEAVNKYIDREEFEYLADDIKNLKNRSTYNAN